MLVSHLSLWPVAIAVSGTVLVSGLRYVILFVGFRQALRHAPQTDRLAIYREFAMAMSLKRHPTHPRYLLSTVRCKDPAHGGAETYEM
jgi:hypothetical protein